MRSTRVAFAFVSRAPLFAAVPTRATSPLRRANIVLAANVDDQLLGAAAAAAAAASRSSSQTAETPRFEYSAQRAAQPSREQGADDESEKAASHIPMELEVPPPHVLPTSITPRVQSASEQGAASKKGAAAAKLLPTPGLSPRPNGAQVSSVRVLLQSPWMAQLRLPSRDRAIMMAGELALILSVLLLLRAGVSSTLRWVHTRLNATRGLNTNIPYEASVFECMQRPLQFLSLFTVGTALAEVVSRPLAATGLVKHIMTLRELSIIFSATWFLLRWISKIKTRFALDKRVDKAQVDATSRIATVAIVVVSLLISLDTIGVNIQTVLAFGGIGGVAIGFAGREIISNFFGGFMIYVTQPFSVGEWIRSIEERELNGTVEDIGWYLTRVRTWDKRPLYIPNSRFSTLIVENGSRMDNRRIVHTLHLRHEDMPVVLSIVTQIENLLMSHPELDPRQHRLAYVDSFDEFSVKLWFSCYTKSVFLYDFRRVQQDLLVKCHEIIRSAGAKLATRNTRDVRPGIDTDRYGPFGRNATFGSITNGISVPEKISHATPENYDVPGALQYGQRHYMSDIDTIESGIDPKRYNQHVSPPASTPSRDVARTGAQSLSGRDSSASKSLSEAAMEASAAAFLFSQRGASRKKDDNGSGTESGRSQTEIDGSPTSAVDSPREPATMSGPAGAQMKISRAPPRNDVLDGSMQGSEGAADGKALQNAPAGQMKISRAPPKAEGIDNSARDTASFESNAEQRTPPAPSQQPTGQMRITRAPPRVDPTESNPSATADDLRNQQASVAAGQMKISRAPARNENMDSNPPSLESTNASAQITWQTRTSRTPVPSEMSGNVTLSGDSVADDKYVAATPPTGQMKISRAPPRREVTDVMGTAVNDPVGDAFNRQTGSSAVVKTKSSQSVRPEEKTATTHSAVSSRSTANESSAVHSARAVTGTSDKDNMNQNVTTHSSTKASKSMTAVKGHDEGKSVSQVASAYGKRGKESSLNLNEKQKPADNEEGSESGEGPSFDAIDTSKHISGDEHALSKHATAASDESKGSSA
eukprot:TRINITY_DN164_c0_g1_i13.p1 TRINITY_DN164_c0_g1~~TRINITY_DN164_c0_g1_i13.p1  ORF type:complete len:1045 (-),score=209.00 TRINITY_DN164_c0_g1_i13:17809-20943(-)